MKQSKIKFLARLMALVMMLSLVPTAWAEGTTVEPRAGNDVTIRVEGTRTGTANNSAYRVGSDVTLTAILPAGYSASSSSDYSWSGGTLSSSRTGKSITVRPTTTGPHTYHVEVEATQTTAPQQDVGLQAAARTVTLHGDVTIDVGHYLTIGTANSASTGKETINSNGSIRLYAYYDGKQLGSTDGKNADWSIDRDATDYIYLSDYYDSYRYASGAYVDVTAIRTTNASGWPITLKYGGLTATCDIVVKDSTDYYSVSASVYADSSGYALGETDDLGKASIISQINSKLGTKSINRISFASNTATYCKL